MWRLILLLLVASGCARGVGDQAGGQADTTFASTVARLSETGGFFDTDNLISNEGSYLHVMGGLRSHGVRGGAFIGVGPDQSFSYIAQIRPEIALMVDIRRDNLLEHLLFKAAFDLSRDRLQYLGVLLARPVPDIRDAGQSVADIVAYLDRTRPDAELFTETHRRVVERIESYGVPITAEEWGTIRRFHQAFAQRGLDLQFESFGRAPQPYYPNLRQLVIERDLEVRQSSYLATDSAFQFVRALQRADRVIPLVGDLAGGTALPAIARFLREREIPVSAYYVSNADYYIAQDGKLAAFLDNVAALPRMDNSVIIRSVFQIPFGPRPVPVPTGNSYRSVQLLQSIPALVIEARAGRVGSYYDVVTVGLLPSAE